MDEKLKMESKLQSAAAFVEGGIQDACDDSCSICLEDFCESDPSTMTSCKHEFHLQCILEWCQRSSQCPMCWQPISLKDPTSQELFEGVENERKIRSIQTRSSTIFRHPTLGDIELPHLQDNELEERIIQHLAAAAAMGRTHHIARREGQRSRSGVQQPPQFMMFSTQPNTAAIGNEPLSSATSTVQESSTHISDVHAGQQAIQDTSRANMPVISNRRLSAGQTTPVSQDRAGPSDLQSFADSLKSRLNAVSTRYKDTIAKNTRGWKERLFSRNTSVSDVNSEARRDVNAGIASISGMMDHVDLGGNKRASNSTQQTSVTEQNNETPENNAITSPNENIAPTSPSATTPS